MSARAVARRYAKALAEIGDTAGALQALAAELETLETLVSSNRDLQRLVSFPLIAPAKRAEAFDAVLAQAGASETLRKFFQVVAHAARLALFHDIVGAFRELVDAKQGVVEARITSAQELSEGQSRSLTASLASRTGRRVRLVWGRDPALLGGLKIQLGSMVYDASLQGRLRLLKARLLSA